MVEMPPSSKLFLHSVVRTSIKLSAIVVHLGNQISRNIQPGAPPAIIRLKKLGTIDSTELEKYQEELKTEKKLT